MPILSLLHEVKSVESQRHRARKSWVHATAAASAKALSDKAIRCRELRKPVLIFARRAAAVEEERSAPSCSKMTILCEIDLQFQPDTRVFV